MVRFEIIIYWSNDDQAFVAEVPELFGCMAEGATYQETLANAEGIIQEWTETAKEMGKTHSRAKGQAGICVAHS